jgi:hypothetical protein
MVTEDTARALVEAGAREAFRSLGREVPDVGPLVDRVIERLAPQVAAPPPAADEAESLAGLKKRKMGPEWQNKYADPETPRDAFMGALARQRRAQVAAAPPPPACPDVLPVGSVVVNAVGEERLVVETMSPCPPSRLSVFGHPVVEIRAPWGGPVVWRRG